MHHDQGRRLNSWKQIARYLGKDRRTAMRWEKHAGMPVRRIPGTSTGRSVYAYTVEIDAWLANRAGTVDQASETSGRRSRRRTWMPLAGIAALLVLVLPVVTRFPEAAVELAEIAQVEGVNDVLLARDVRGEVKWSYELPDARTFFTPQTFQVLDTDGDGEDDVVFAANTRTELQRDGVRGELLSVSADGVLQWRRVALLR